MIENLIGYIGFFEGLSFDTVLNNAYQKQWTGIIQISWAESDLYEIFQGNDLDEMLSCKAFIVITQGVIRNVLFSLPPSDEFFDKKLSLNNLLLLIRAFEGMGNQPKINGHAVYMKTSEATALPNILNIDANLVTSYSLLADEQAIKHKASKLQWPDIIE